MATRGSIAMQFMPTEVYKSPTPPTNPPVGFVWANSAVTPNELLEWTGKGTSVDRLYSVNKSGAPIQIEDLLDTRVVAISSVSGASIRKTRKNLVDSPSSVVLSGVTITVAEDGAITLNGLCTAAVGSPVLLVTQLGCYLTGQMTLSMNNAVAYGADLQLRLMQSAGVMITGTSFGADAINRKLTFTLNNQLVYGWAIRVQGGITYSNVVIRPQLEMGAANTTYEAPDHEVYTADSLGAVDAIGYDGLTMFMASSLTLSAAYTGTGWSPFGVVQRVDLESVSISKEQGLRVDTILANGDGSVEVLTYFNARGRKYGLFRTSTGEMLIGGMVLPNGEAAGVAGAMVSPGTNGDVRFVIDTQILEGGTSIGGDAALRLVMPAFAGSPSQFELIKSGEKQVWSLETDWGILLDGEGVIQDNYSNHLKTLGQMRFIVVNDAGAEQCWLLLQRAAEGSVIYTDGAYAASDTVRTIANFCPVASLSNAAAESIVYNATPRMYFPKFQTVKNDYTRYVIVTGGTDSRQSGIKVQESGLYRFVFHVEMIQSSTSTAVSLVIHRMPSTFVLPTTRNYVLDTDLTTRLDYHRDGYAPSNSAGSFGTLVADLVCTDDDIIFPTIQVYSVSKNLTKAFFTVQKIG